MPGSSGPISPRFTRARMISRRVCQSALSRPCLSSCKKITSVLVPMTMRVNRVVQLGPDRAWLDPHARLLLGGHALLVGVLFAVEAGTATQSRCRSRRADVLQDRLVTD